MLNNKKEEKQAIWEEVALDEVVEVLDGKRKPIKKAERQSGEIPYYGATGIIDWVNDYIFDEQLILVGEDGENLRSRVLPMAFKIEGKSWVNNHAHVLRPINDINIDYLTYFLESINYEDFITGSAQPKLNQKQLRKIRVLVPTRAEQDKIAAILTSVDDAIGKTEVIIEQTEKVKKGIMQQLLSKGTGHIKFKKTEIGEIPESWDVVTLKDVTNKITDGAHHTPNYIDSGIPFLRVTDIQTEKIDFSDVKFISQEEHDNLIKRCHPEKGDILLSKNGTIGITKIVDWDEEFSIFVSLCLIKPKKDKVLSKYLMYFIQSEVAMKQFRLRSKQGTVTNLHLVEIRELICGIPSFKEQQSIVNIIDSVTDKLTIEKARLANLIKIKKGLMQDLLTGKVRVKVDD
jgi:restriction endonuclease S subunit